MLATEVDISPQGLLAAAPPIAGVRVHEIVLRKSDPTWRFALGANPANPGLLLELRTGDGLTGIGSAGEIRHLGHDLATMRDVLAAAVAGLRSGDVAALADLDALGGPARAIVQMALLDLVARARSVPAHRLLGPRRREAVELIRILSLKSPEKMAANAVAHQREGYRNVKIKLDNGPDDVDYRRVAAIRAATGPDFGLTLDANQSYPPEAALRLCERLEPLDIILFEQPVPADDLDGLAFLAARSPIPIEADEAADTPARVREIVARRAAHGISIKVAKLGGVDHAAEAIVRCREAGLAVRIGAHVGSQVLNAAALHLAVVADDLTGPSELAEFARLEDDPVHGLGVDDGVLPLPGGPGLGVSVDNATFGKDTL